MERVKKLVTLYEFEGGNFYKEFCAVSKGYSFM